MICALILFFVAGAAQAWDQLPVLYRDARVMGFAGAFTAVADDTATLFYNPAGLAKVKGLNFKLLTLDIDGSLDPYTYLTQDLAGVGQLMQGNLAGFNAIMGQNIYVRTQGTMSFTVPNFGIALLADVQFGMYARNTVYPNFDMQFMTTQGIQAGTGFTVFRFKKAKIDLSVGAAAKLLWRRGGERDIPALELFQLTQGPMTFIASQFGGYGMALGYDAGILATKEFKGGIKVSAGTALTDIGNTTFAPWIQPVNQNWSLGLSGSWKLGALGLTLAYDYQRILDDLDGRLKHNLGLEVSIPVVTIYGGLHEGSLSFGAKIDLWLFEVTGVYYVEEAGSFLGQNPMARILTRVEIKLPL